MERRTFLTGAGVAALLPVAGGATAKDQSLGDGGTAARQAPDLSAALQRFRATIPRHFDREYVNNAVVPFFLGSIFAGEPHSSPTESWKSSGWAGRGDRRRHRVLAVGVSAYFAGAP
jgi:hypothetical protein